MDPAAEYVLLMDFIPVDNKRYRSDILFIEPCMQCLEVIVFYVLYLQPVLVGAQWLVLEPYRMKAAGANQDCGLSFLHVLVLHVRLNLSL